ncbi:hypothetical protein GCM10027275_24910 [Rhabdobacter roseus]
MAPRKQSPSSLNPESAQVTENDATGSETDFMNFWERFFEQIPAVSPSDSRILPALGPVDYGPVNRWGQMAWKPMDQRKYLIEGAQRALGQKAWKPMDQPAQSGGLQIDYITFDECKEFFNDDTGSLPSAGE